MLALAMNFPISRLDSQKLKLQSHNFLSVLVQWYCDELFNQFHRGLLRSYVTQEDALAVIRGRWRPEFDVRRFPGRKDRLNCEFDELTANNLYNRILKAALQKARFLSLGNSKSNINLEVLANWFSDVGVNDIQASAADVRRLPKNRLVSRYSRALMMAEWFLDYSAPDLRTGKGDALSLLFDMNALFQAFLARVLRMVLPSDFHLREEGPRYFLAKDQSGSNRFQMKPDICILKDNKTVAIIDAKWKRLSPDSLDGKWGVSQADMYQLFAYAKAYQCNRVALWYPGHDSLPLTQFRPSFEFLGAGKHAMDESLHIDWLALEHANDTNWLQSVCNTAKVSLNRLLQ
jgi:5-methylcytosine-specific restriction enzyme subunit McrC